MRCLLVSILLPLLLPRSSSSLNIMMYAMVGGPSHEQFNEKLINLLAENGHTVDVIFGLLNSQATLKESYAVRKMVIVPFPGSNDWGAANPLLANPFQAVSDWTRLKPNSNKFSDTAEVFCDALLDSTEVAQLLSSTEYDLGLISGYDLCPFALAYRYQVTPVISYVATPLLNTQYYYAVFFESYENRFSFTRRVLETLRTLRDRYYHYQAGRAITAKCRARFGNDFADVREILKETTFDFCNSHALLEEPSATSLRVKYIGGIGRTAPKPISKELNALLNQSKRGTAIFSFGTQISPDKISEELKQVFINTFKRFPEHNFLWKYEGETPITATNIFNLKWLPQTDLLHDSRVVAFISHMGLNSFTETAFAGVPVVAIPLFADQIHNAKRAKTIGIGEIVRNSEITEENLYNALEKVLYDERYRNRATEIARMIVASPDTPQRTFLEGIEYAAKFKNLSPHLRLLGADYNHFAQIGWDVVAFHTVLLIVLAYFSLKLFIFMCRMLIVKMQQKHKIV